MRAFSTYFFLAFSALLPLVNPPGTALELLSIVGAREARPYKVLARKMAVNMTLFLAVVAVAGPYVLQFFGISIEVLQLVGGAVLAALGWQLLNQPDGKKRDRGSQRTERCRRLRHAMAGEDVLSAYVPGHRRSRLRRRYAYPQRASQKSRARFAHSGIRRAFSRASFFSALRFTSAVRTRPSSPRAFPPASCRDFCASSHFC